MDGDVEGRIARILSDSIVPGAELESLGPDTPLVEGGLALDSVSLLELIVAVEESFGVTVEDEDLSLELVATIGSLADFVRRKRRDADSG
jgi:acyl carrier protein